MKKKEPATLTLVPLELQRLWLDLTGNSSLSQEQYELYEKLARKMELLDDIDFYYADREEKMRRNFKRLSRLLTALRERNLPLEHPFFKLVRKKGKLYGPLEFHITLFMPLISMLATEEQKSHWLPLSEAFKITGCYAQTEMGHGSDVRSLQTTATYLPQTEEFELHTPSIKAVKFWPGGLGRAANHCVI